MFNLSSIKIQTLGSDPNTCDIVEFAMVLDDLHSPISVLPVFQCYFLKSKPYSGEAINLCLLSETLGKIACQPSGYNYIEPQELGSCLQKWLKDYRLHDSLLVVGLSSLDLEFLRKQTDFFEETAIHYRYLDLPTLFFDPRIDQYPPGIGECLRRSGVDDEDSSFSAVEQAKNVVRCMRYKFAKED